MARITRAGGPSFNDDEIADPDPPVAVRRFMLGDDALSAGDNSMPSGQSEPTSSAGENPDPLSPAPTMGNPSENLLPGEGSFTAPSTVGDGLETEQTSSDEVPPYEEWLVADLKEELRNRELSTSGTKDELVKRLYADDEQAEQTI